MKKYAYTIMAKNGLHARPAGAIASACKPFKSTVKIFANGKEADGKRLLSVMSLGATYGTELLFEISGEDESEALEKITELCSTFLGGDE